MKLTAHEIRAAVFVLHRYRETTTHHIPPSVTALADRLESAVRQGDASPWRHQPQPAPAHFDHVEYIGTKLAADILGWSMRRVQRHAADLDGRRIGDRLVFPAHHVRAYRDAIAHKEDG